jgi:hypothetical protein
MKTVQCFCFITVIVTLVSVEARFLANDDPFDRMNQFVDNLMEEIDEGELLNYLHSDSKFRVFATEPFRSEKSTQISDNSTEVSGEINETFESV